MVHARCSINVVRMNEWEIMSIESKAGGIDLKRKYRDGFVYIK